MTNEAAAKLRELLGILDSERMTKRPLVGRLDEALAEERRDMVERIRVSLWPAADLVSFGECCEGNTDDAHYHGRERGYELARRDVLAILDAEAAQ